MTEILQENSIFPTPPSCQNANDIDLLQLVRTTWSGRRTIIIVTIVFAVLGLAVALISPTEYTASAIFVPQQAGAKSQIGSLSGLAAMAGINLNLGSASEITPAVYPRILSSESFQLELMQTMLTFHATGPVSLYDYYSKFVNPSPLSYLLKYTAGLPGLLVKAMKGKQTAVSSAQGNGIIQLTEDQLSVQKKLEEIIAIEYNDKDGYVTVSSRMPEALAAAQLTQRVLELLQEYITEFKLQKARVNLDFIQQRYDEVKKQAEQAQNELARFRDRNKNVATATAQTEIERLSNDYNLIYGVYAELAKQLEQARIQVKEDTPVLTVIKPVSVPLERSGPGRSLILIIWIFLGGMAGIATVFGTKYYAALKKHWKSA
ncbi:MAG: Wzz/FepE/Etk N-terminal domain-containing protein [Mangrovibacterium sp.]